MASFKQAVIIFVHFLWLGCISFGGPAAHISNFHREFVQKRRWLSEADFAQMLALVQFLPGPSSSQLGFAIGKYLGGLWGGCLAFIAFTLPSVTIMFAMALGVLSEGAYANAWLQGALTGLTWFAVVVVLDAVWSMSKQYCRSRITRALALFMLLFTLFSGWMALIGLLLAALLGVLLLPNTVAAKADTTTALSYKSLLWLVPFLALPFLGLSDAPLMQIISGFFTTGALVFGGGHVILPLLQEQFAGQLDMELLLTGFALAQAMPGPIFALAAFLAPALTPQSPILGALLATLMLFIPGFLLVLATEPLWQRLQRWTMVQRAVIGINAAVVGLLLAMLIHPMFSSTLSANWLQNAMVISIMLLGLLALRAFKLPVLALLLLMVSSGMLYQMGSTVY